MLNFLILGFLIVFSIAVIGLLKFAYDLLKVINKLVEKDDSSKSKQDRGQSFSASNEPSGAGSSSENIEKRKARQAAVPEVDIEKLMPSKPIRPAGGFGSRINKSDGNKE